MQAARVVMNLSLRNHVKPALKQLHWLPVEQRITYKLCLFITTSTSDKHHYTYGTVYPLSTVFATICRYRLRSTGSAVSFCQEQELDLENVHGFFFTPVQPPKTLFLLTFMASLLTTVHSENNLRVYFLIVLTTDYCWCSWACRRPIAAPYKLYVDW